MPTARCVMHDVDAVLPLYRSLGFRLADRRGLALWLAGPGTSAVELHGVDLCSGVRNDGRLDGARLADFFDVLPKP